MSVLCPTLRQCQRLPLPRSSCRLHCTSRTVRPFMQSKVNSSLTYRTGNTIQTTPHPIYFSTHLRQQRRQNSSLAIPGSDPSQPVQDLQPVYQLTFTCKPCGHRSSHRVTKQGYHHGTVLIQCPGCKNRHVISDHLKVFLDQKSSLEDILRKKTDNGTPLANLIKKGNWVYGKIPWWEMKAKKT